MSKSEFLLLIPAIMYGAGLIDLMKIFNRKMYWELPLWALSLFLTLVITWFGLFERLELITVNPGIFLLLLIGPLIFARSCYVLTPEEANHDTKSYFFEVRQLFFFQHC